MALRYLGWLNLLTPLEKKSLIRKSFITNRSPYHSVGEDSEDVMFGRRQLGGLHEG